MARIPKYNLELNTKNGLHFYTNSITWNHTLSFKTKQALIQIQPYAFYCLNNEPLILFFHNPQNKQKIHQQCWNFNKAAIVIFLHSKEEPISDNKDELLIKSNKIEIFNGFDLDEKSKSLKKLPNAKINQFSYWNIVSGKVWELHEDAFKNEEKVDNKLLGNIKVVREELLKSIQSEKATIVTNRVLGRLIFTRYLIDRKVKINFGDKDYLTNEDLTQIITNPNRLYQLFRHLQVIFNGDLFPFVANPNNPKEDSIEYEKRQLSQNNLVLISILFKGGEVKTGQLSLFDIYDFSIIPIELVSNIYEYFMGNKKQNENKAFYTPPFLVDYLVNETIEPFLQNQNTWHCTVLDPACGSGIFLVEALRRIILKYKVLNKDSDITTYKKTLLDLLEKNIYGIDKDGDAIDVAIFSLYVTVLDFIDPKNIEGFKFRSLLGKNFFVGDFFPYEDKKTGKIIDLSKNFKNKKLDFIIGNPPWGKNKKGELNLYIPYAKQKLKNNPKELHRLLETFKDKKKSQISIVNNNEIAQGFIIRTEDFSDKNMTTCALLVTSKVLHNGQSDVFRNYWLNHTKVDKVVDFSAIRKYIFGKPKGAKDTIGPCAFLIYKWTKEDNSKNIIQHYSPKLNRLFKVFRILAIQSYDYKEVKQQQFIENDWAWKVFLYGNLLDFKFINYLKNNFKTISDFIKNSNQFTVGRGVEPNGSSDKDTSHFKDAIFIDTKKDLNRYFLTVNKDTVWVIGKGNNKRIWDKTQAYRAKKDKYEEQLFDGKTLLISKGLTPTYQSVCAFTYKKAFFRDSITGIKTLKDKNIPLLKFFVGLLNSVFSSYFIYNTGSSVGIEREVAYNNEKFALPVAENLKIANLVDEISIKKEKIYQLKEVQNQEVLSSLEIQIQLSNLEKQAKNLEQKIEEVIAETYDFTKSEKALINFSQTVSIPLFKGEETPYEPVKRVQLKNYVKVFENHFTQIFNRPGKYFKVDVFQSDFMIGIQFNIVKEKPNKIFNYSKDKTQQQIINMLSVIAFEERTDKVFIQKDVKIINKNSFCIIKPNEYKCWHEAVAYLDLDQFIPALIQPKKVLQ